MITALTDRAVIALTGPDRIEFLNGMISQDVTKVTPEQPLYGCLLTPQGKYFSDFFIISDGERILLDIAAERLVPTLQRLQMFKLRSKVMLSDVSADYRIYVAWGDYGDIAVSGFVYTDPRLAVMGRRVLTTDNVPTDATLDDYHAWRIQNGVPAGVDFELERTALLEANLDLLHGIAWDKGCYMGQELTARTHYRGLVKKRLLPFSFVGAVHTGDAPAFDSELRFDDTVIGHVRSTAGSYGMALVKLEFAELAWGGDNVVIDGQKVNLMKPEWFTLKSS